MKILFKSLAKATSKMCRLQTFQKKIVFINLITVVGIMALAKPVVEYGFKVEVTKHLIHMLQAGKEVLNYVMQSRHNELARKIRHISQEPKFSTLMFEANGELATQNARRLQKMLAADLFAVADSNQFWRVALGPQGVPLKTVATASLPAYSKTDRIGFVILPFDPPRPNQDKPCDSTLGTSRYRQGRDFAMDLRGQEIGTSTPPGESLTTIADAKAQATTTKTGAIQVVDSTLRGVLYQIVTSPIIKEDQSFDSARGTSRYRKDKYLGTFTVGYLINDSFAVALKNLMLSDIIFLGKSSLNQVDSFTGVVASSFEGQKRPFLDSLWRASPLYVEDPDLAGDLRPKISSACKVRSITQAGDKIHQVTVGENRYLLFTTHYSSPPRAGLSMPGGVGEAVGVGLIRPLDKDLKPIMARFRRLIFPLVALGVLTFLLLSSIAVRKMTRSINKLTEATRELTKGNYDHEINLSTKDEMGQFAQIFEQMRQTLKKHMAELKKNQEELLRSHQLKAIGEMAGQIIHDFKTPMAVIQGAAELLTVEGLPPERRAKHSQAIKAQINRMVNMTQDILDFTRGEVHLNKSAVKLSELIREIEKIYTERLAKQGINLECRCRIDSGYPDSVVIDREKMWRAIVNLVNNAREAMPQGGQLVVEGAIAAEGVTIQVKDTGTGIPDAIKDSLYEPFVTYGKSKGTGLGLSITRQVVAAHAGGISFVSESGRGTTFTIWLPSPAADATKPAIGGETETTDLTPALSS